jgi:hypothetical protein
VRVPSSRSRNGGRRTGHGKALLACLVVGECRGREECRDSRGRPLGSRPEVEHECCIAGASQLADLVSRLVRSRGNPYLRIRRIVARRCISRRVLPWVVVLRRRSVVLSLGWRRR